MKNFIPIVVLMGLVLVQGSSLFEQVLENGNGLDNEGNDVLALSTDFSQQTGDISNLKSKDNRDVIGTIPILDKKTSFNFWEDRITPEVETSVFFNGLKKHNKIQINSENKVPHLVDESGNMVDMFLTLAKLPGGNPEDIVNIIPEMLSVENDLNGLVECQFITCTINVLGFGVTVGYDRDNQGLYIYITFLESIIMHEKISKKGIRYCEPLELLHDKVKTCIEASDVRLSSEKACLNLGFSVFGYSYTFPDMCILGAKTER